MTNRKVKLSLKSRNVTEGAGVKLKRAFAYDDPSLDPFLLLDDFHSSNPDDYMRGFPWHPHRGIETITYVLHGSVEHSDSLGNSGVISDGDIQWMTAGSGIIHQELPKKNPDDPLLWGFQLWANLPSSHKMMTPRYRDITDKDIPVLKLDKGILIKIIAGELDGIKGPVKDIVTEPEYLDVSLESNTEFKHIIKKTDNVFAYVISGEAYFDSNQDNLIDEKNLVIFREGDEVIVNTASKPVRFLLISGKPIKEPVAWRGPIVMNTEEELRIAFEEYNNGTFIKSKL
ncbi:MAG: pirin family protein [Candidatus Lokiarchaeota archaeon]|nr:pirin family protein [Candidatus Lokiarchaeota archaeon]